MNYLRVMALAAALCVTACGEDGIDWPGLPKGDAPAEQPVVPDVPSVPEPDAPAPTAPVSPSLPLPLSDMSVPAVSSDVYIIRSVQELPLRGDERLGEMGEILQETFGMGDAPIEGRYSEELVIEAQDDLARIVLTLEGIPDDAIKAEQYVLDVLNLKGTDAVPTDLGMRQKCWRGDDPDAWTTARCP